MSNQRTKWMQEVIQNSLSCDAAQIKECFKLNQSILLLSLSPTTINKHTQQSKQHKRRVTGQLAEGRTK